MSGRPKSRKSSPRGRPGHPPGATQGKPRRGEPQERPWSHGDQARGERTDFVRLTTQALPAGATMVLM